MNDFLVKRRRFQKTFLINQKDENKSKESNISIIASKKQFQNFTCYFCGESK